jgi:N-acetylglucosaminyldiphosphoundecaprenol N-acetyl-beta-D-mannosaminyltransferase
MIARENILGVGVSVINIGTAVDTIDRWITKVDKQYVCVTGVHGIMESSRSADIRRIHNQAGMVTPDGMPLVWLLKRAGYANCDRVCGRDLMAAVFERSTTSGYRHFLYGSSPETLDRLARNLSMRFRGTKIVGAYSPPFRPLTKAEDQAEVDTINRACPDIVWVGLSTPKQERWMAEHNGRIDAKVLIGVGAAFDFMAGLLKVAPEMLQRSGLEWAFRLAMEPRRLWGRYLKNNSAFMASIIAQRLGLLDSEADVPRDIDHSVALQQGVRSDNDSGRRVSTDRVPSERV